MKKEIKIQVPISNENIAKTDTVFIPRSKFHTLLSNNITNESFYNLKQMSLFDPEKDEHFEVENLNSNLKINVSDFLGEQVIINFNDLQLKIWDFILSKAIFFAKKPNIKEKFTINIAELCDFIGLSYQTKNINNLHDNLKLMSKLKLKFKYNGIDSIGNLFEINALTKKSEIVILLGVWIDTIKQSPELQSYMLIDSKAYTTSKTNNGHDPYYLISRKIHELYKNNYKNRKKIIEEKGQYEITISIQTFLKCLLWSETSLKKDTKKFYNKIITILDKIEEDQKIFYDVIECHINGFNKYQKFLNTKFIFYSENLQKEYSEKSYK